MKIKNFKHVKLSHQLPTLIDHTTSTGRTYTTDKGNVYPSITTILNSKEKPYLKEWRESLGKEKADAETKRCSETGSVVHLLSEKYLNNEKYPDILKGCHPKHVQSFKKLRIYLNRINNIRGQELALYSDRLKIAGRVDCIAEYLKKLSIIDFKTSNNIKTKDMISDYFKQCTAYAIMWHELTNQSIENIVILMTVEKGVPLIFVEKIENWIAPLLKDISNFHNK